MHVVLAPLYKLLHNNVHFHWTSEHDDILKQVKETLTAQCELTLPNTTHPFFIMVDASAIGIGTVLVQSDEHNQMQVISYNSRLFTENEQKSAIMYRELCAVAYALEIYEFIIIGSNILIQSLPITNQFLAYLPAKAL